MDLAIAEIANILDTGESFADIVTKAYILSFQVQQVSGLQDQVSELQDTIDGLEAELSDAANGLNELGLSTSN